MTRVRDGEQAGVALEVARGRRRGRWSSGRVGVVTARVALRELLSWTSAGRGPRRRDRRAALPAAALGGRARARRHRHRLRRHRLAASWSRPASCWPCWRSPCSRTLAERSEAPNRGTAAVGERRGVLGVVLGALLFAGSLADGGDASWPASSPAPLCAAARLAGGRRPRWSAPARRLDGGAAALLNAYADVAALVLAAIAIFVPPVSFLALIAFVRAARWRAPPRGREVRRAAHPAVSARRAAEEARPRGHRLAEARDARPGGRRRAARRRWRRCVERGTYVRDCVSAFPSVTPVAAAAIATGMRPGRAPHPVDELVPPRRGALRRVRLVVPGHARLRRLPLALRHRLQHEHGAPHARAQDGVRAPRRRRPAHRLHHLPDLPRPPPPRALSGERVPPRRRGGAVPPPGLGPAASSSTPTCSTRGTPAAPRRSACPASATGTRGCVGAYLVENDLFDFLLFSLPDNDTYSHKRGPDGAGRARSPRPTARSSGIMHVAGGSDAFLEDHAVIVMSDHSQIPVEDGVNLAAALGRLARARARRPGADRGRARGLPVGALGDGLRARRGARASELAAAGGGPARRADGVDLVDLAPTARPRCVSARARRAALRGRAASCATSAADAGAWRATHAALALETDGRAGRERHLPRRARPALVGARLPARRRRAACRPSPATSSSTGAGRTTWAAAATARSTAATREGAAAHGGRPAPANARAVGARDVAPLVLEHFRYPRR